MSDINLMNDSDEIEMDEMGFAAVRLNGLLENLTALGFESQLQLDSEGVPFLLTSVNDIPIRFMYLMVGEEEENLFLLEMSLMVSDVEEPEVDMAEEDEIPLNLDAILICETFNQGSLFGNAVYHPEENMIELRAQTLEYGGVPDRDFHENLINMLLTATVEFRELAESFDSESEDEDE